MNDIYLYLQYINIASTSATDIIAEVSS